MNIILEEKFHANQEYLVFINNKLFMNNKFSFIKELEQLMLALNLEVDQSTFYVNSLDSPSNNEEVDFHIFSPVKEVIINIVHTKTIYTKENHIEYSNQVFINNKKIGEDIHLEAIKKTLSYLRVSFEVDGGITAIEIIK